MVRRLNRLQEGHVTRGKFVGKGLCEDVAGRQARKCDAEDEMIAQEFVDEGIDVSELVRGSGGWFDDKFAKVGEQRLEESVDGEGRLSEADVKGGKNAGVFEIWLGEEIGNHCKVGVELEKFEEEAEEGGGRIGGGGDVGETGGKGD